MSSQILRSPNPKRLRERKNTLISYRKLSYKDDAAIVRHLLRLSDDDRRMRFFGPIRKEVIKKLCAERPWHESIVIGVFMNGVLRGVGELIWHWSAHKPGAEIALSVEAKYQNYGVGSELLRRLLVTARNRYVGQIHMLCLADNIKMQRVAKKFEAELILQENETEGRIWPPIPTYLSIFEEVMEDSVTYLNAVFYPRKT